jgi:hypothetical protein
MERERVKEILTFYRDIDRTIAFNTRVIKDLEEQCYCLSGGGPDGMPKSKYRISRPTESLALNVPVFVQEEIRDLQAENKRLTILKTEIFQEINKLPFFQKIIVYDFYVRGFKWVRISEQIRYSPSQCKNIRNRGLDNLARYFTNNQLIENSIAYVERVSASVRFQ